MLAAHANPFSIITRGPLIVRDVDVLAAAASKAQVSVTFSVPTLDEEVWRTTEPGTAPPLQRLRALSVLADAGIRASVGMAPILPGLSDRPDQLRRVVAAARAAGASGIWANVLYLKPGTREHFLECLAQDWPELLPQYETLYDGGRAYLRARESEPIRDRVRDPRPLAPDSRPPARAADTAGARRTAFASFRIGWALACPTRSRH